MDNDEVEQMIRDCENRESKMNDWERGTIQSMREAVDAGQGLSPARIEKLEEIWEKVT